MDDTRAGSLTLLFTHFPVLGHFHVRQNCLAEMERRSQIRLDVSHPLARRVEVVHGLAILPEGGADAAVVDEHVDAVVEEGGGFFCGLADGVDAAEVAERPAEGTVCDVRVQVGVGGVFELVFVVVEDVDSVALFEEVAREATADALGSLIVLGFVGNLVCVRFANLRILGCVFVVVLLLEVLRR